MTVDALGNAGMRHHDPNGYLIGEIDRNENSITYENDEFGRPIERLDQGNNRWQTSYTSNGVVQQEPTGAIITRTHRMHGTIIREQDQEGNYTEYRNSGNQEKIPLHTLDRHQQFDDWNRLVINIDSVGRKTNRTYDIKGRMIAKRDALNQCTIYDYDPENNLTAISDPLEFKKCFAYDNNDELTELIDENQNKIQMDYDKEGRLSQITNPNNDAHVFEYDPLDRLIKDTGFDHQSTTYDYDPEGNIIRVQKADGVKCLIDYNKAGLPVMIKAIDPDGNISCNKYTYDAAGRMIRARNEHSDVRMEYDALGRIIGEHQNEYFIKKKYDSIGNEVLRKSALGHDVQFEYDTHNCLETVTLAIDQKIRIVRDDDGHPIERHLPGHIHSQCAHDPNGRLVSQAIYKDQDNTPHLLAKRRYTWDKRGKLKTIEDKTRGTRKFIYDPAGQLKEVYRHDRTEETYRFDACGNNIEGSYTCGNRQKTLNDKTYQFDLRGNVVGRSSRLKKSIYRFNTFNQLVEVLTSDAGSVKFFYDALGRRIMKKRGVQETRYFWDQFRLAGEETGQTSTDYIYYPGTFVPLCCRKNGSAYFFQTDHLGTPMEITDDQGQLVWTAHYETFGKCHVDENATYENNIRFQGQYHDKETELHYNCFRYYDPETGRYISQDPISYLSGDYNFYRFCLNDPVNHSDPVGLAGILLQSPPYLEKAVQVAITAIGSIITAVGTWLACKKLDQKKKAEEEKCKDKENGKCPPCPQPPTPEIDHVPPSRPHHPCPGDHWHYYTYHQNPKTCECFGPYRKFGGCLPQGGNIPSNWKDLIK